MTYLGILALIAVALFVGWGLNKSTSNPGEGFQPKEAPAPPEAEWEELWVPEHGSWGWVERCHCGRTGRSIGKDYAGKPIAHQVVCPMCGRRDKWEVFVGRYEYETMYQVPAGTSAEDLKRQLKRVEGDHRRPSRLATRNRITVRWTEDMCEVPRERA